MDIEQLRTEALRLADDAQAKGDIRNAARGFAVAFLAEHVAKLQAEMRPLADAPAHPPLPAQALGGATPRS